MNLRNNKGFSGVDISVAIIIMLLFVSLIVALFYNYSSTSKSVNRASEASYLTVQIIEAIKLMNYDDVIEDIDGGTSLDLVREKSGQTIEVASGYNVEISIENYRTRQGDDTLEDVIKIVTVNITYPVGNDIENTKLSTIITREV